MQENFGLLFPTLKLNIFENFSSSALKRHLLKRHLTLSENRVPGLGGSRSVHSEDCLKLGEESLAWWIQNGVVAPSTGKCSVTRYSVAASPSGARQVFGGPMRPRQRQGPLGV